ncbi:MAG: ABC transporter substrate-binding protein [Gammaproteobacteria bacterium]|nr:ABC transporter substrate-binding protein [Gammaproteobacteria bacterium]
MPPRLSTRHCGGRLPAALRASPPGSRWLFNVLLALLLATGAPRLWADDESPARVLVLTTAITVLERLRAESDVIAANPARLDEIARETVLPHFDFPRMSQRVLGIHWRNATADQRARFLSEFTTLLVRTYAKAIYEYRESAVNVLPARELGPATQRVRTEVSRGGGVRPLQVDYDVYHAENDWKVVDVAISGISLVVSYRAGFNADIGKLGMDGLIAQIAEHNAQKGASG